MYYNKNMDKQDQVNPEQLEVQVPDSVRPGVYANVTNVSATPNELVLNFIFANQNDKPNATQVARVIVSRRHADQIAALLRNAVETANELDPQK